MVNAPVAPLDTDTDSDTESDSNCEILRGKWMLDGCCSLAEVGARLQEEIRHVEELQRDGWELREEIADDYGFMWKRDQ